MKMLQCKGFGEVLVVSILNWNSHTKIKAVLGIMVVRITHKSYFLWWSRIYTTKKCREGREEYRVTWFINI